VIAQKKRKTRRMSDGEMDGIRVDVKMDKTGELMKAQNVSLIVEVAWCRRAGHR
jgi:hypothetical protein